MKEPEAKSIEQWLKEMTATVGIESGTLLVEKEDAVAFAEARVKEVKEEYERKIAFIDSQFESRVKTLATMMSEELIHKAVKEATDKLKQWIAVQKASVHHYLDSGGWRKDRQNEIDVYEHILRFLEEAKQP